MSIPEHGIFNGELCPIDELSVPLSDAGFLYGYGLFESIGVFNGKIPLAYRHYDRLSSSATVLDIPFELSCIEFTELTQQLIDQNKIVDGALNWYLSAGDRKLEAGRLSFGPSRYWVTCRTTNTALDPIGVVVGVRDVSYGRSGLDKYKTLSYIKPVLERLHCSEDESILIDQDGQVLEGIFSNVFFVLDGAVVTPLSNCILPGVMRDQILELAVAAGIHCDIRPIDKIQIDQYDEVFMSNAVRGIIPIKSVSDIPGLASGPVTQKLKSRLSEFLYAAVNA